MNKRALYYSLLSKGIQSTNELDNFIVDLCFILGASRQELGILASAKGLISGSLSSSLDVDYMQIPDKFCEDNTFPASVFTRLKKVIVVEKDTVF